MIMPFPKTVTALFTGEGSDTVTASVVADPGRLLVIRGQGGNDRIEAGQGNNVVFGDYGRVLLANGLLELIVATDTALGGADTVTSGAGNDRIIGGQADDSINAGDGANIVLGDSGQMTLHAG